MNFIDVTALAWESGGNRYGQVVGATAVDC
jgi:hypothetical protein